jgi:serine/threonine protein phosphatase PrpC
VEEAFEKGSCDNITALIVTFHQQPDEDSQAASST